MVRWSQNGERPAEPMLGPSPLGPAAGIDSAGPLSVGSLQAAKSDRLLDAFEALLLDLQRLDLRVERRGWNTKLGRGAQRSLRGQNQNEGWNGLDDLAELPFVLPDPILCLLGCSDIRHCADEFAFGPLTFHGMRHDVDVFDRPVRNQQAMLTRYGFPRSSRLSTPRS